MKILLINNRYHLTGGPERYLFGIEARLRALGHEVVPFAVRYRQNRPTPYERYFVPPPGGEEAVYFRDVKGPAAKARFFANGIYSREARRRLASLIAAEKPDLAYVIIVANVLSPSVFLACRDAGVPIVMRLSDFHLVAPCYLLFDGNEVCERCLTGTRLHAVRKRCLQGSAAVSAARIAGMAVHDRLGLYELVDRFVAPSQFLREKMIAAGTPPEKIVHIPSFVEAPADPVRRAGGKVALYAGRLSAEKGVDRMLEAYRDAGSPGELWIAGDTQTPEGRKLVEMGRSVANVCFLGRCTPEEIRMLMASARIVLVPSICYENLPLVALEAMAAGKAVVAHRLGSLPEVVRDGVTGRLCDPKEPREMSEAIASLMADAALAERLGRSGKQDAEERFAAGTHVERLLALWGELVPGRTDGAPSPRETSRDPSTSAPHEGVAA